MQYCLVNSVLVCCQVLYSTWLFLFSVFFRSSEGGYHLYIEDCNTQSSQTQAQCAHVSYSL